jgi:EpsD family peptidyl-prolyl cis-trans isomerase
MNSHTTSALKCSFLTLLLCSLVACGNKGESTNPTQVAAKVGKEEISIHQINQALTRINTSNITPEAGKAMGRDVLERLIDQQLAVNQAMETKLDRVPEIVLQIEASRREILSRAYLQRMVSSLPKPTPDEVKKYYAEHPQLFSERRIFNVQEIVVPVATDVNEQLRSLSASNKPIEEVANWLKGKDIKFGGGSATRTAEQIPFEVLPQIQSLKDGQSVVIVGPKATTFLRIASSQAAPVPEAAALPRIEQFLANQRANETIATNMKQLRATTDISYVGEFVKTDATTPVPAQIQPKPDQAQTMEDQSKSVIDKGVAGIK